MFFLTRTVIVGLVASSLFPAASYATERELAQCTKLAREIAVGESVTYTSSEINAMKYFAACEASNSSSNSTLNIGYGAFSLGGTYDDAKSKQMCTQTLQQLGIDITTYNKTKIIFNRALDTIDKCIAAANHGWNVDYKIFQPNAIALGLSHGGDPGGSLKNISIFPRNSLTCEGIPEKLPVTVTTTQPVNLTCTRTPKEQIVDGVTIESAKDATIILQLGASPLPITLPGYSGSIFNSINEQLRTMQQAVGALQKDADSLRRDSGNETQLISGGAQKCPAGQVVVGIEGLDIDNGRYCTTCISSIKIFCRPIVDK